MIRFKTNSLLALLFLFSISAIRSEAQDWVTERERFVASCERRFLATYPDYVVAALQPKGLWPEIQGQKGFGIWQDSVKEDNLSLMTGSGRRISALKGLFNLISDPQVRGPVPGEFRAELFVEAFNKVISDQRPGREGQKTKMVEVRVSVQNAEVLNRSNQWPVLPLWRDELYAGFRSIELRQALQQGRITAKEFETEMQKIQPTLDLMAQYTRSCDGEFLGP